MFNDSLDSEASGCLPNFWSIYCPGLVMKKGIPYCKDSVDGVGIVQDDMERAVEMVPIEVKS